MNQPHSPFIIAKTTLQDSKPSENDFVSRLLSLLSAQLIPRIEGWEFLQILAQQSINPLPENLNELAIRVKQEKQRLYQEIKQLPYSHQPLIRLIKHFNLESLEIELLLLALAPEMDERFGDLFSHINGFPKERRLPLHKACLLLLDKQQDRYKTRALLIRSALWTTGLLHYESQQPLFERILALGDALSGGIAVEEMLASGSINLYESIDRKSLVSLQTRATLHQQIQEVSTWLKQQSQAIIVFKTDDLEIAKPYINALSNHLQCNWFSDETHSTNNKVNLKTTLLTSIMLDAIAVIHLQDKQSLPLLQVSTESINKTLIIVSRQQYLSLPANIPIRQIKANAPQPLEQASLWHHYLQPIKHRINIDLLANQNKISVTQIKQAIALAQSFASQESEDKSNPHINRLTQAHLSKALKEIIHEPASAYTSTEWTDVPWQSLIINKQTRTLLNSLVEHVYQRITVENRWNMVSDKKGGATGLVALLHGASGTGKTFAAKAIACKLNLPLLRVDLSRIVSKYIGETETRLNEVFSMAEGYCGLLFFDECESMFAKRTGVKDAHDRHANLQVNFLLQRLEQFEGITLLASNYQQNMDTAFTRRISFSIHFPRPTASQQYKIWQSQLPKIAAEESINLTGLVNHYDLVGGEIRNCALRAAYSAATNKTVITTELLEDAILQEFIKMGRPQSKQRLVEHPN